MKTTELMAPQLAEPMRYRAADDNAFALAVAVFRDRIRELSPADQNDLRQLIPDLLSDDEETSQSAQRAIDEILEDRPGRVIFADTTEPPGNELNKWMEFVSEKVRAARTAAGLTQEQLSERSGLPQSHISKIENRVHSPTSRTLARIAKALGISPLEFDPPPDNDRK